jgi:hypothetical protein
MNNNTSNKYTSIKNNIISSNLIASNIITTPCEKVLSILREAKYLIQSISKEHSKLVQKLEWVIKVITSRSLYSYELKEKETINKLSKENPEFKQLVDFVSEYNEKVIKMNRKYNYILTDKLLQKPSTKLNRKKLERRASLSVKNSTFFNLLKLDEVNKQQNKNDNKAVSQNFGTFLGFNKNKVLNNINSNVSNETKRFNSNKTLNNNITNKFGNIKEINPFELNGVKRKINLKKTKKRAININDDIRTNNSKEEINENLTILNNTINYVTHKSANLPEDTINKYNIDKKSKNRYSLFPSVQKISITINNNDGNNTTDNIKENTDSEKKDLSYKRRNTSINALNISLTNSIVCGNNYKKSKSITNKNIPHISKGYSFLKMQNKIIHEGYNSSKLINEKNFDVFELKDIVGYSNVLPFAGRLILENLGLIDEEILTIEKLDPFLVTVSNTYKQDVLYHNCLHGTDVTQSCYIFFSHSNAEKIANTNVLDLLSIFIAALGHDIGHPGLNNTFQINDSTDMAITYNDISVLENFHASTLFKIIRKTETNIFEKLSYFDYKTIRKRMICEILATDMANHGKVISLIKSKITVNEDGKNFKFNLLTGNEQTKNDEQQSLLDFIIHLADLAHNTRLFSISLKWVKLLSEEFWRQGDLEKQRNLPISFLCDRENTNIPQSQIGFISGFILPTFDCLSNIFPTLKFTLENANNNLKKWQKLSNEGKTGLIVPEKKEDSSESKHAKTSKIQNKENNSNSNIKNNDNIPKKKSKFSNTKSIENNINNQKKINSNINNDMIRQSEKKEIKYIKFFKNNDESKKSNKAKKKEFNTPVKLKISDDFNLLNSNKYNEFLELSNKKKDKVITESNIKKIGNKEVKKNVYKIKK